MKDYEPLDDNDDPGGQKCAGQHPLQQAIQMTSPQTTFPIGPDTQVPWPCWLHRRADMFPETNWEYWSTPPPIQSFYDFYSTLPASQRPEEPTISGQVAQSNSAVRVPIASGDAGSTPALSTNLGGDDNSGTVVPVTPPPVSSDPTPGAQALDRACAEAARECCVAHDRYAEKEGCRVVDRITAILRRHFGPVVDDLRAELDRVKAELAALRADKERLDWLEGAGRSLVNDEGCGDGPVTYYAGWKTGNLNDHQSHDITGTTARDAIDAARLQRKEPAP